MGHLHGNNRFATIIRGYKNVLLHILGVLVITALILGCTFCIIYPLWYSALNFKQAFTMITGGILALGGILFITKNIRRKILREKERSRPLILLVTRRMIRIGELLAGIVYFYFFTLLLYKHLYLAAAGTLVIFLFAAGFLLFTTKNS